MPKTFEELKRPLPRTAARAIAWLEKNVKASAPYYSNEELAQGIGVGVGHLKNVRSDNAVLRSHSLKMPAAHGGSGKLYWSLPKFIARVH